MLCLHITDNFAKINVILQMERETDTLFAFLHYPQCVFCPVLTSSTQPIAADGSPSLSLVLAEIQ